MILQFPSIGLFSRFRSTGQVPDLPTSSAPSTGGLGCRIVQVVLAIYLIPALLIVLLVGFVGLLFMGLVRLLGRLLGSAVK
jgi:hypothetical protein